MKQTKRIEPNTKCVTSCCDNIAVCIILNKRVCRTCYLDIKCEMRRSKKEKQK